MEKRDLLKLTGAFAAAATIVVAIGMVSNPKRWSQITGLNIPEITLPSWPKSVEKPKAIKSAELGSAFSVESQAEAETEIWFRPAPSGFLHDGPENTDSSGVFAMFHRDGQIHVVVVKDGQPDDDTGIGLGSDANWLVSTPVKNATPALRDMQQYLNATYFKEEKFLGAVRVLPVEYKTPSMVMRNGQSTLDISELGLTVTVPRHQKPQILGAGIGSYTRFNGEAGSFAPANNAQPPVLNR